MKNIGENMGNLKIISFLWITFLALLTVGCTSSKTLAPLNADSAISRDNAIIIFNIGFEDSYLDAETEKEVKVDSSELLKNEKLVEERILLSDKKRLKRPLHYIANFKAKLISENSSVEIERFGKRLNSYEDIGGYAVSPGKYQLEEFEMTQYQFNPQKHHITADRWEPFQKIVFEKIKNWDFEGGKIYYLGDLKFNFRTQRFMFGLFPREQLVSKIRLRKIELKDNFKEVKEELKNTHTWFPTDKIINISEDKTWEYLNSEDKERIKEEKEAKRKEAEKIKSRENRDKEKFFF